MLRKLTPEMRPMLKKLTPLIDGMPMLRMLTPGMRSMLSRPEFNEGRC